jgi:hypothetical protein
VLGQDPDPDPDVFRSRIRIRSKIVRICNTTGSSDSSKMLQLQQNVEAPPIPFPALHLCVKEKPITLLFMLVIFYLLLLCNVQYSRVCKDGHHCLIFLHDNILAKKVSISNIGYRISKFAKVSGYRYRILVSYYRNIGYRIQKKVLSAQLCQILRLFFKTLGFVS